MNSKKIIARQVAPECQESPLEYGDAPDLVFVFGNRNFCGMRYDEIKKIYTALAELADDLDFCPESASFISKADGGAYAPEEWDALATIAREYAGIIPGRDDAECARDALELIHGEPFALYTIRGCCQGDWQRCIMPERYGEKFRDAFEMEYFNTGEEWIIDDDGDEFSVYTHMWTTDEKRREIADAVGCSPSAIIMYEFTGYSKVPEYREA